MIKDQMEEYARRRLQRTEDEEEQVVENEIPDPNELAKIWFVILVCFVIAVYFIVELLSLIINMALFVTFRVLVPIVGVYIILNLFNIGRILPRLNSDQMMRTHRALLRTISFSDRLKNMVENTFEKYTETT